MSDNRTLFFITGCLLAALAAGMLIPAMVDLFAGNTQWRVFLVSAFLTGFIAGGLILSAQAPIGELAPLSVRQAFILTNLTWLLLTVFSALPFVLSDIAMSYTDAFFEAMSGLSTTGATVMRGLDYMPPGILIWRALLQWFGGIGIIVMAISVLPLLNIGGMQLFRTESSDNSEKILPRTAQIAGAITRLYIAISCLCALAYLLMGMSTFDAIAHAMTTIATGGFSTHDASFGHFNHAGINLVAIMFMMISSFPFVAYLQIRNGRLNAFWRDEQMRGFLLIAGVSFLLIFIYHALMQNISGHMVVQIAFNVVSILTGTGYAASDYGAWGGFAIALFFILTFLGGCAGSTSCGLKTFRIQVILKVCWRYIRQITLPHGVFMIRYNGKLLNDTLIDSVMIFVMIFFLSFLLVALLLGLMGVDMVTALSAAAAAIANVGPGLGPIVGPAGNYADLPEAAKWVLSFAMLLGRLEFLTILVIFIPSFWRK